MPSLFSVFDIVEVAAATGREQGMVMTVYSGLGSRVELNWLRDRIIELPRTNRWQALARAALRDDLYGVHRSLTQEVLDAAPADADGEEAIDAWIERNEAAVERCMAILADIKASRTYDTTTLPVALREVRNLIHADAPPGRGPNGRVRDGSDGSDGDRDQTKGITDRAERARDRDRTKISPPKSPRG